VLSDLASDILSQLGGLRVSPPAVPAAAFENEAVLFEPVLADTGSADIAMRLHELTGQTFYPLAEWVSASCVYIGSEGRVCDHRHGEILSVGENLYEGLRVVLPAERPLEVMLQL
jgi:hypothetical protein